MLATLGVGAALVSTALASTCIDEKGVSGPCMPGHEFCGEPFPKDSSPAFHLMDQHGCGENDPNGPVFDPVHGVIHHFYQIHLAAPPGHGPDYGHFVSKDFVNWAPLPTAIWNGLDSSTDPFTVTKYDNEAIFTGSAQIFDGAGPGGKGPGIVNIYPGLCNKNDWPACGTGTLLAQAVPADYAGDELLVNWTKPSYNPIMENTQRDPSSPWKTEFGTWRLRTYNQHVYEAASDAAVLKGQWTDIGVNTDFRGCECPSFYPLPASTPGFEAEYEAMRGGDGLPTNVHKTSCGGDWWQLGSYSASKAGVLGNFSATPGWEDLWEQKKIDQGHFYASKDNLYPTTGGKAKRRINWGWATVPPASTQTLPREVTFNAAARCLQQYPIEELTALRGKPVSTKTTGPVKLPAGAAKNSEIIATFTLPKTAATLAVTIGAPAPPPAPPAPPAPAIPVGTMMNGTDLPGDDGPMSHHNASFGATGCQALCAANADCKAWTWVIRGEPQGSGDCCQKKDIPCPHKMATCTSGAKVATTVPKSQGGGGAPPVPTSTTCSVDYVPGAKNVSVSCGGTKDIVPLLPTEKTFEIRMYSDATFLEAYFQQGRAAMTIVSKMDAKSELSISSLPVGVPVEATSWPIKGIWTTPEAVRKQPRVYK
jgi:sucrose-6-phosphate hydrolase SacC (GH32 family)